MYAMVLLSDLPRKERVETVVVRVHSCVSGKLDEFCSCEVEGGGWGRGGERLSVLQGVEVVAEEFQTCLV